jgi:hypothetical protein
MYIEERESRSEMIFPLYWVVQRGLYSKGRGKKKKKKEKQTTKKHKRNMIQSVCQACIVCLNNKAKYRKSFSLVLLE